MIWQVSDEGKVEVRLKAEGEQAIKVARIHADRFFANIVGDLSATQGVDIVTNELRYRFAKTHPAVDIIWKAQVPDTKVADVREYLAHLGASMSGFNDGDDADTVEGEIE